MDRFDASRKQQWARFRAAPIDGLTLLDAYFTDHVFERHSHDTYAVGVTQSGVQRFDCRGAQHDCVAGDLLLFNPDEPHNGRSATDDGFGYKIFYVPSSAMNALLSGPEDRASHCHLPHPKVHDPHLGSELLRAAACLEQPGETLRAQELLTSALRRIVERHGVRASTPLSDAIGRRRLEVVREFLHAHCDEDLKIEHLAAQCGLSRAHLTRAFTRTFGVAPHGYLNALRLRRAQRALLEGRSIADAALACGFSDQSHFTRRFKGAFGATPRAWLMQMQREGHALNSVGADIKQ
jgi:AraC-like DNA-binding protein